MVATINFATGEVTITSAEERRAAAEERRAAARPVLRRVQPCMLPRPLLLAVAEKAEKAEAIKARLLQEAAAAPHLSLAQLPPRLQERALQEGEGWQRQH